jgi:ribonuclease PH
MGLLPRTHGSALFQRGDTQVLSIATLGPLSQGQTLEGMEGEGEKKFMHHYNMGINPFSVGEVKRIGSPNRRDIGHGNLVEISINGVLPTHEAFPYAIRVVSEVLAANASTSQAAVCATSMAMINAGVPIEPVAGIAMGLVTDHEDEKKFQVITDMRAVEDFYGEMDFKVAGTKNGITGIQMDTKLPGITMEIVEEALKQGKAARANILKKMSEVMQKEVACTKNIFVGFYQFFCFRQVAINNLGTNLPPYAARKCNKPITVRSQIFFIDTRLIVETLQKGSCDNVAKISVALFVFYDQGKAVRAIIYARTLVCHAVLRHVNITA